MDRTLRRDLRRGQRRETLMRLPVYGEFHIIK
jgi:hypothetical protein